ncbi:hypothetical protein H4CHR_03969 [Variovorax sp. PBS-H4]|uniref:hypothetical protein n=1 Tax=Variovorax sp. PBS-H4 TaxID=434008 RepID=UPI001317013A|nr:hypothetical protein [Variovorax sp. PBS-H4]VTU36658.1 hypothetical protein H4CHR_03969 [Variovorax sp. PBS-H4]
MPTPDKFRECYDAWKRASDQHRDMMDAVMAGGPLDAEAMERKLGEIDGLHKEWMELAARIGESATTGQAKPARRGAK